MDAWVFPLPAFDLFGDQFAPFGQGSLIFAPFRVGGTPCSSKESQFVVGSVIFVVLCLVVVGSAVRSSVSASWPSRTARPHVQPSGMNARASTLAVFALSAAIAGIGGGIYGEALGSAAPDVFQFFTGLSILLVMVVFGISSLGAGVAVRAVPRRPDPGELLPGVDASSPGAGRGAGIGVGTSPNGTIPSGLRPVWISVVEATCAARGSFWWSWWACGPCGSAGVIGNWTMTWIDLAAIVVMFPASRTPSTTGTG